MQTQQILPVLYDLAVTIGGEIELPALLTRTLQRLLFHTSYAAGFVCLLPSEAPDGSIHARIDAAVGDFELVQRIGQALTLPCAARSAAAGDGKLPQSWLKPLGITRTAYRSYCHLPLPTQGVVVLLTPERPESPFDLAQVLTPVLAQLDRAIVLCRAHDAQRQAHQDLESNLAQLETQYRALMATSPMGVVLSSDGTFLDCNAAFLQLFGYEDATALRGKVTTDFFVPEERSLINDRIQRRASGEAVEATYESVGLRRDGSRFSMLVANMRVVTQSGARTLTYLVDLTEQKHTEHELQSLNMRLQQVLETVPMRIFWKDTESRYLGCNTAFAKDAGVPTPQALIGKLDSDLGWSEQADLYRADDQRVMQSRTPLLNFEEPQTTPDGHRIWLRTSKVPLIDPDGGTVGLLGIYDDITEQKAARDEIQRLTNFDALTGLPNRARFADELRTAVVVSARTQRHGAVLFIDLDDFKSLNDSYGPAGGDAVLQMVASRLHGHVAKQGMVARSGGDLYLVLLENLSGFAEEAASQAEALAQGVRTVLREPLHLPSRETGISASIGIVLFKGSDASIDTLLKHADTAMRQAKSAGRDCVRFFDLHIQAELEARARLVAELRQALPQQQLCLFYQKQVKADGQTTGAEVLLRWRHPERGLVSPDQFIALAEETGLIVTMGQWVLEQACTQLRRWQDHPLTQHLTLAVNVSARQFHQDDFVEAVTRILRVSGAPASRLKLELTESLVLKHVQDTIGKMRALKALGLGFALDDFGTGYSSLQYLRLLPLDQLKIDQSFVREITHDANDEAIVETIIAMTRTLGLNVIAEGVETVEQHRTLLAHGCGNFQGFLFGRPVNLAEFERSLNFSG